MGKIIFIKEEKLDNPGEIVTISELKFKFFSSREGLYSSEGRFIKISEDVTDVMFQDCKFNDVVNILCNERQNIVFNNCLFESYRLYVTGANNVILDSSYFLSDISICANSCAVKINPNSRIENLGINANNINIYSENSKQCETVVNTCELRGNSIEIKDVFVNSKTSFKLDSDLVQIRNSSLVANSYIDFTASKFLVDKKTIFEAKEINLNNNQKELVCGYTKQGDSIVLLGEELLEGKQQTSASFVSVLKGISTKLTNINLEENKQYNENLDFEMEQQRSKIAEKIEKLQKEQQELEGSILSKKLEHVNETAKRKIKEIPYK